jgi:hypothetical protein
MAGKFVSVVLLQFVIWNMLDMLRSAQVPTIILYQRALSWKSFWSIENIHFVNLRLMHAFAESFSYSLFKCWKVFDWEHKMSTFLMMFMLHHSKVQQYLNFYLITIHCSLNNIKLNWGCFFYSRNMFERFQSPI